MTKMVAAACALSLVLGGVSARADEVAAKKSRGMMVAGIVLTVVGATIVIPGAGLIGAGASCHEVDSYSCGEQGAGLAVFAGGLLVGVGASLVVTGVPMWSIGRSRMKKAQLSLAPTALTARF